MQYAKEIDSTALSMESAFTESVRASIQKKVKI